MKYKVAVDCVYMNNDNKIERISEDCNIYSSYHKSKKSAMESLNEAIKREKTERNMFWKKLKQAR